VQLLDCNLRHPQLMLAVPTAQALCVRARRLREAGKMTEVGLGGINGW
jgi:hypothetical protein